MQHITEYNPRDDEQGRQTNSGLGHRMRSNGLFRQANSGRISAGLLVVLSCTITLAPAQEHESYHLVGEVGEVQDRFGESLALSGPWLAVGAPSEPHPTNPLPGGWGGAVYLYRRSQMGWLQHQVLGSPSATTGGFGRCVALRDGTLVVSDDKDRWLVPPPGTSRAGKVFIYRLVGSTWTLVQELVSSTPGITDRYGSDIDFDGNRLIVGEPNDQSLGWFALNGGHNGAIYVYERSGGAFVETAMITPPARPGPGWNPSFPTIGHKIALHGDTIAATASAGEEHVQIYQRNPAGWEFTQMVVQPNPQPRDEFGHSVDIDATTMAIGRPNTGSGYVRIGKVDIFSRSGPTPSTAWAHTQTLVASNASFGLSGTDEFGKCVVLEGDTLFVGAPQGLTYSDSNGGQVYVFERSAGGHWLETARLTSNAAEQGVLVFVGSAIASQHGTVVVTEPLGVGITGTHGAGAVNIYERPLGEQECMGEPNSAGAGGAELEARGTRLASVGVFDLLVRDMPPAAPGLPLAARFPGNATFPGVFQGTLCLAQPIVRIGHALASADGSGVLQTTVSATVAGLPILAGEVWRIQVWYRDANPGPTANFSSSLRIEFE